MLKYTNRNVLFGVVAMLLPSIAPGQAVADRVFATTFEVIENQIVVSPSSVVLIDNSSQILDGEVLNAAGLPISGEITWSSSHPDIVSVDNSGVISSSADIVGSAFITATARGAADAKVLVVVAEPAAETLLVSDEQIISVTAPDDTENPVVPGTIYEVTLVGSITPALAQGVLGIGEKPVAGRAVAVESAAGNTIVSLEVVPMHELFASLNIEQIVDLSTLPIEFPASVTDNFTVTRDASGTVIMKAEPAKGPTGTSAFFDFGRDCETGVAGFEQALSVAPGNNLYLTPDFSLDFLYTDDGLQRLVVEGDIQAVFELQPRLRAQITGMIECKIQLGLIRLPVGGAFSLLFSGLIPLGAGFALDATVTTTEEVGYDFTVAANASPRLGVACEPQCELVKELNFGPPQTAFRPVIPASIAALDDTLKLALGAFAFVYADLSFGNPFIEALQFESLNVKAGVRQTVDLESMDSQITKPDYASNFGLSLVAKISLGNKIQDFLDALDISLIPTGFELTSPLAQSAHGGLSISGPQGPGSAKAGEPVTFSVTLMPPTYLGLDSIGDVQIYRQEQNTTTSTLTPAICPTLTPNQVGMATCTGAFTELDVGSHTYVAVYYPRLFGVELPIPLEIAANSQTGFTVETAVDPDPDPAPETRFEVEVCAEVYNHDDGETLSEDCPEYDEEQPASDSASISAGGASANVTATSGPSTISITSSASSGSSANASSADACGTIDAEFSTVASRTITINPNISSMSNSSRANFDVRVVACSYVGPQKGGCQGPEGSLRFQGASSGPPQIRYKDGVFKDYDGGSLTIPLDSGNLVSISVCSGNWAEPGDGSVNSESTTSLNLN